MDVLLICASATQGSPCRTISNWVATTLIERDLQPMLWDLAEVPLEPALVAAGRFHWVVEFRQRVRQASAIVFVTPALHGSYAGLLKTALHFLPERALHEKVVGMVTHSDSAAEAASAREQQDGVVAALANCRTSLYFDTLAEDFAPRGTAAFVFKNELVGARCTLFANQLVEAMLGGDASCGDEDRLVMASREPRRL